MKKYTGIYGSWYAMKQRCGNPNNKAYKNYGGRGITYDKKWESFIGFSEDMKDTYTKGMTLERIDVNNGYFISNCKWIPKKMQMCNTRRTVYIEYNGEKRTMMSVAEEFGMNFGTFRSRYYRGMPIDKILLPKLYRPQKLSA